MWLTLESGASAWLPEARPCSCGNRFKVVTQGRIFCARCLKPRPEERISGYVDCEKKTYHEGAIPR